MEKDLLEQYYNEVFKKESDPDYKDLPADKLRTLRRSFSFASYQFGIANDHMVKAIKILLKNFPTIKTNL